MVESGRRSSLAHRSLVGHLGFGRRGFQRPMQLRERDPAFQALIRGFPDDAHAAATDPAHQAIAAADESLWFGHPLLLPRSRGFFHLGGELAAGAYRYAGSACDHLRWTAPRLAGKGSSMSNAIIKQQGDSPIVADNIWEFRLGGGSFLLGAFVGKAHDRDLRGDVWTIDDEPAM